MRRIAAKMPKFLCIRANGAGTDENAHAAAHLRTNILIDQENRGKRSHQRRQGSRLEFVEFWMML